MSRKFMSPLKASYLRQVGKKWRSSQRKSHKSCWVSWRSEKRCCILSQVQPTSMRTKHIEKLWNYQPKTFFSLKGYFGMFNHSHKSLTDPSQPVFHFIEINRTVSFRLRWRTRKQEHAFRKLFNSWIVFQSHWHKIYACWHIDTTKKVRRYRDIYL